MNCVHIFLIKIGSLTSKMIRCVTMKENIVFMVTSCIRGKTVFACAI